MKAQLILCESTLPSFTRTWRCLTENIGELTPELGAADFERPDFKVSFVSISRGEKVATFKVTYTLETYSLEK